MHAHYVNNPYDLYFQIGHQLERTKFNVPRLTRLVNEIRIFDLVVVFYKEL